MVEFANTLGFCILLLHFFAIKRTSFRRRALFNAAGSVDATDARRGGRDTQRGEQGPDMSGRFEIELVTSRARTFGWAFIKHMFSHVQQTELLPKVTINNSRDK